MQVATYQIDRAVQARLLLSLCLNAGIALSEIVAGLLSGSAALIADATHNLGDVFALGLALFARVLGSRPPTLKHTYGLKRFEVLAASLNAAVLATVAIFIIRHVFLRLFHPEPIRAGLTILVAGLAFLVNTTCAVLLRDHHEHDLNVRSVFLHLLQDAVCSLAVLGSAVLTRLGIGTWLDPVAAMFIGAMVLIGSASILRQALATVLEGVPDGIGVQAIVDSVEQQFQTVAMHHVHVWQVGPRQRVLTAHVLLHNMDVGHAESLCNSIRAHLRREWSIQHVTLEPEVKGCGSDTVLGSWNPMTSEGD